jgi:hypothetical protein
LLCLNAFAPYKNKEQKNPKKESTKAMEKRLVEEEAQQRLRAELAKLNVTTSIILGGYTSYVEVLDVSVNKVIKQYIKEYEDYYINTYIEESKEGKFSISDCRISMTQWVRQA